MKRHWIMAGGGTGGHVIPALAVARELKARGHEVTFVGTRQGMEAKLVPAAGFPIEWIEIGGLNRVGLMRQFRTLAELPVAVMRCWRVMRRVKPGGVFSMGGFVAGPVMLAAALAGVPVVLMEPNAYPGFTARRSAWMVKQTLISFPETARFFPRGRTQMTGLPVRREFAEVPDKQGGETFTILATGGSRGARSLNEALRDAWPAMAARPHWRLIHQTGGQAYEELAPGFAASGAQGRITAFVDDMPAAFAEADVVVSRSGAGAVAELCAAGKPSILIPFPFAADDHQRHNAQALASAGAAKMIPDRELTGERLLAELDALDQNRAALAAMSKAARALARPDAAAAAATILEELCS